MEQAQGVGERDSCVAVQLLGEPQHLALQMSDKETEAFFLAQQRSLESALEASSLSPTFSKSSALFANSNSSSASTVVSLLPSSASSALREVEGVAGGELGESSRGKKKSGMKAAAAVSRVFFNRAQVVKTMGTKVGKKIHSKSSAVSFSLPPMGLSIASSVNIQQPQAQSQSQQQPAQ